MTKTYLKYRTRITVLSSLVLLTWAVLAARLFQIQVVSGAEYRSRGQRQAQVRETIPATRGTIYDRNAVALTANLIHYSIGAHPNQIEDREQVAELLTAITGRPADYYRKRLASDKPFVYLERNLADPACRALLDRQLAGVVIEKLISRSYPQQNIAGQTLGFINVDGEGIAGLELQYDRYLAGEPGWQIKQANGLGQTSREISYPVREPVDGAAIYLTIDLEYQTLLQDELTRRLQETGARSASGILLNPQDGSILALASVPDYDPGTPAATPPEYQKNRVISDQFEPGSTYKIVCATAALDQNLVPLDQEFNCESGQYTFAGKVIQDWESFGLLNFSQIIENSSNVGVIKIAERVGVRNLYRYSRDFGFGAQTGIGLTGETGGVLRQTTDWSDISLAEVSIGYEVGVTTLQLACAYAAVANGGILMKPRLVERIVAADGSLIYRESPEVVRKVASQSVMQTITGMLTRAVDSGTGVNAGIPGWDIAGKTGTAQKYVDGGYSRAHYTSNFAGFFPAENPQLVGVFVLDEPKIGYHWGSTGAAPLFKRVIQRIINLDDELMLAAAPTPTSPNSSAPQHLSTSAPQPPGPSASPTYVALSAAVLAPPAGSGTCRIPETRGMSLRKALHTIRAAGLTPKFQGSGTVAWQSPRPGTSVPANSVCVIGLQ